MENFSVEFYETASGECPVDDFINAQSAKMQAKILRTLEMLKEQGNKLRMPHSEHLEDGIFQIRAQVGNDITRVLYFFVTGNNILQINIFFMFFQKLFFFGLRQASLHNSINFLCYKTLSVRSFSGNIFYDKIKNNIKLRIKI